MNKEKIPKPLRKVARKTPKKVTDNQIKEALRATRGLQSLAAEKLDITQGSLSSRISSNPDLLRFREECLERRLDMAENSLSELIEEKNLGAICFLLKTLGKRRGYTESQEIHIPADVIQNFNSLMKQISCGQSSRKMEDNKSSAE